MWPSNVKKQKQTQNKINNNTYLPNTQTHARIHASSFTRTHTFF